MVVDVDMGRSFACSNDELVRSVVDGPTLVEVETTGGRGCELAAGWKAGDVGMKLGWPYGDGVGSAAWSDEGELCPVCSLGCGRERRDRLSVW